MTALAWLVAGARALAAEAGAAPAEEIYRTTCDFCQQAIDNKLVSATIFEWD